MTKNALGPPKGEAWIWTTRELGRSDASRSLGINARRFVDFLKNEHMGHGGRDNGKLKATYLQLEAWGIGARYISTAIAEAERVGLVDCRRGGMRVATTYSLTWLPLHDGSPPTNRWRTYRNPKLQRLQKSSKLRYSP